MKKIISFSVFSIIVFSLFSPFMLAETQNILIYGESLGKIENSIKTNYNISKMQKIPQDLSNYGAVVIVIPKTGISTENT